MKGSKCKRCRRAGEKLFLKGERCHSPKCAMVKRDYPPGAQGKNRWKRVSAYGKQLKEKQKIRHWYNLREKKFKRYVKDALNQRGKGENSQEVLIRSLEKRLDNVIFRLGLASSRSEGRQLAGHGHFLVNGRRVDIPSYEVKKGDKIEIKNKDKAIFSQLEMKGKEIPSWLEFDIKSKTGEVVGEPTVEEAAPPAKLPVIFEYYSR